MHTTKDLLIELIRRDIFSVQKEQTTTKKVTVTDVPFYDTACMLLMSCTFSSFFSLKKLLITRGSVCVQKTLVPSREQWKNRPVFFKVFLMALNGSLVLPFWR